MRQILLLIFISLIVSESTAQKASGTWATLSLVTFQTEFDENFGMDIQKPKVSLAVKALEGKEVELTGFIIPLEGKVKQSHFMLSAFPQSMCFFCGKAGPETAAQVFMRDNKKIAFTDDKIKVKGILRINEDDITSLLYTIEDAEIIKNTAN